MRKTIEQLWGGNIHPMYRSGVGRQEIQELEDLLQRNLQKLNQALGEKTNKILENYNLCMEEYLSYITEQAFCDGFSVGVKLTAEALIGE